MKEEITRCDICKGVIDMPNANGVLYPNCQCGSLWTTPVGDVDACHKCIAVLLRAKELQMIDFDMVQFYERANFKWSGDHWTSDFGRIQPFEVPEELHDALKGAK